MLFSVIVPTCDRDELLVRCLEQLLPGAQTVEEDDYEVIVTDDGRAMTSETTLHEKFPWARWTQGPRRGPAANRNHGAQQASAPWLVFCDDDCLPTPQLLEAYARAIRQHPTIRIFEGRTSADRPKRHPLEDAPINQSGGCLWSCNLAISTELFRQVGGFNEAFPYAAMEDMDFSRRLRAMSMAAVFVPEAEVIHPWRMVDLKAHARRHVASQLIYARLHPEDRGLFTFRRHCRNVARYYARDFTQELRQFGWQAVRCQPVRWWEIIYRGWQLLTKLDAASGTPRS
jgi:GT2 family glycosyltransferase